MTRTFKGGLLLASSILFGAPWASAFAQSAPSAPVAHTQSPAMIGALDLLSASALEQPGPTSSSASSPPPAAGDQEVVVTGTILRRKLADTSNPITTVTAQDLLDRSITTITDAVQDISANSSSALPNSFTANGAFAAGAANVSLRGLTSNSTLVIVDGLRTAYYPLADDGVRNFVDLNTIPDVITDHVDVFKDGASSTYGADAIAGVVNVVTKKTYQGVMLKAEGSNTEQGGGGETQYQALLGHGDLRSDGYNVYIGLEFEHDDALYSRQRSFPYNTADLSSLCGTSLGGGETCRPNGIANGLQYNGQLLGVGATNVPVVVPIDGVGNVLGNYQLLNPAAGCGSLNAITVTPAQASTYGVPGITSPVNLCQQNFRYQYGMISPDDKRYSISVRGTKTLPFNAEAWVAATFYQNVVTSRGSPSSFEQQATPGSDGTSFSSYGAGLPLPVYVCAAGVNCSAANGTLNPNNPFAAMGQTAQLLYTFGNIPQNNEQISNTSRVVLGFKGDFSVLGPWHYDVEATNAETYLQNITRGDLYIANLITAVNTGSYNFVNPAANSAAENAFIAPNNYQNAHSQLDMIQANLSKDLLQLWGGPLQLGLTGAMRFESIYDPSANNDLNGATERWFTINPFGAIGARRVNSLGFELDAPVVKQLDVDVSGRYDTYSTGASNFSPKVGGKFTPIKYITFRSTYSQGFRIPSFAESNSLPTTGFVTATAPASLLTAHGNDGYGVNYSLGETTVGTPGLKPEHSNNFTAGFVLDPVPQLSFSLDFYNIEKKDVITYNNANLGTAIADYYAGLPEPTGYTVIAGPPDPNHPTALPELGYIEYGYINQNKEVTSGWDIGATARFNLPYGVKLHSSFDGNYVIRLNMVTPNGTQYYAGTIGPYNNVSASGTPKFRANWSNTLIYDKLSATLTAYFTDGYSLQAPDFGDTPGLCISGGATASAVNTVYLDGITPVRCKVAGFFDFDLHTAYEIKKGYMLYFDIRNLFDRSAPYDPTTYGGYLYNPAWANDGIYGRTFKIGIRAEF